MAIGMCSGAIAVGPDTMRQKALRGRPATQGKWPHDAKGGLPGNGVNQEARRRSIGVGFFVGIQGLGVACSSHQQQNKKSCQHSHGIQSLKKTPGSGGCSSTQALGRHIDGRGFSRRAEAHDVVDELMRFALAMGVRVFYANPIIIMHDQYVRPVEYLYPFRLVIEGQY